MLHHLPLRQSRLGGNQAAEGLHVVGLASGGRVGQGEAAGGPQLGAQGEGELGGEARLEGRDF